MTKVLFIAGNGRSGSTILQNVFAQLDGFTAVGELRYVWGRAALANQLCGCGCRFRECPFWGAVMDRAFGGLDQGHARAMLEATESFRVHSLPLSWAPGRRRRELRRLADYLATLGRLYTAIQQVSGCRVVVDSSKNPSYGYLLRHVDGVRPYYLHVVRDVPGVAHSWGKHKEFEPGVPMARKSPAASALQWTARNLAAELFLPTPATPLLRLRYEDLMTRPRDHVESVVDWLGETGTPLPFTSQHEVTLDHASHTVFGNSVRFQTGPATLRRDERWRVTMPARDRRVVAAIAWPLRLRYGYLGPGAVRAATPEEVPA